MLRFETFQEDYFVDYKNVTVIGGNGGSGLISFARVWCNPYAGPDGADGGNGGHVIFEGKTLMSYCRLNILLLIQLFFQLVQTLNL